MKRFGRTECLCQKRIQRPSLIHLEEFMTAADRNIVDINIRYDSYAGPSFCCLKEGISDIMLDKFYALDTQKLLGSLGIGAMTSGIYINPGNHKFHSPAHGWINLRL